MEDTGFLKYVDIPFAFSLMALIFLPQIETDSISAVTYIMFLGGIAASGLELLDLIGRGLAYYTRYIFKIKNRKIHSANTPEVKEIKLNDYLVSSLQSIALSKPKNRITGMCYFIIILSFTIYNLIFYKPLFNNIEKDNMLLIFLGMLLLGVIYVTNKELVRFPRLVDTMNIYLMKYRGVIGAGGYFDDFKNAVEQGDWVKARAIFTFDLENNVFIAEPRNFP